VSDPDTTRGFSPRVWPRWGRSRPSYPVIYDPVCGSCCCRLGATPDTPAQTSSVVAPGGSRL